jgi:hypothetical protein
VLLPFGCVFASNRSVVSILEKGLEQQPLPENTLELPTPRHSNLRGADYYA